MSDKSGGGLSKSQRKKLKRAEKRKASNSPEESEKLCKKGDSKKTTSATSVTSGASETRTPCDVYVARSLSFQDNNCLDSYYADSQRYVQTVLNHNTPPTAMNVNQNVPYGYPPPTPQVQTPQTQQYPNVFATPPQQSAPPSWALQMIEDLKTLKISNGKIEQSVNNIELKIVSIENKVSTLERKVNEIEQSANFINTEYESQKAEITSANSEIVRLQSVCQEMEAAIKESKERDEIATDKILDLEARSMRENLIFYGIAETDQNEKCEQLVKSLIQTNLQLNADEMMLDRAHRLGGPRARRPRPIVVKFHNYAHRESVRLKSQDPDVKDRLRGSNLGIGIQSPQQYREARKALSEFAEQEKNKGHRHASQGINSL